MGRLPLFLASALALTACSSVPGAVSSRLMSVHGQVNLAPKITVGQHAYHLNTLYQAYTWANLDHVTVYLLDTTPNSDNVSQDYTADGDGRLANANEVKLGNIKPSGDGVTVHVGNLKAEHTYAVRIEAWQIPPEGSDPVRADDGSADNVTHFSPTNDNVSNDDLTDCDIASVSTEHRGFKLVLANQTFSGQASGDLSDNNGDVTVQDGGLSADDTVSPSVNVGAGSSGSYYSGSY